MSAWWDSDHELLLLTPEEFAELPNGTELTSIFGRAKVKGRDEIDMDTRCDHIAYGVTGDHPLRLSYITATTD